MWSVVKEDLLNLTNVHSRVEENSLFPFFDRKDFILLESVLVLHVDFHANGGPVRSCLESIVSVVDSIHLVE